MEILAGSLDWTQFDEENLAKFLDTPTGRRFIPKLVEDAPLLLEKGHVNAVLIRSGEVRGYQIMVREILNLAHTSKPQTPPAPEYPALENDEAWNDGQKIVEEPPK